MGTNNGFSSGISRLTVSSRRKEPLEKNLSQNKAAVVNGSIITQADLKREMAGAQRRLSGMGKPLDDSQLLAIKKEAIKRLIERELLYQESQKKRIKVDETAVKEQLETLKKRFPMR
ncbi:MAG: SurA N-terminal domain-containing protein [Deltaproteobacteria bacterium]|nr:SurA N-terminal domain-containing protein [Deltaproteobacteria bacterium]